MTTETAQSWWNSSSWFKGGLQDVVAQPLVQEVAAQPAAAPATDDSSSDKAPAAPGGAVAQSRFMGRCATPMFVSAPVDGAPVISRSQPAVPAGDGSAQQLGRTGWSGMPNTCDGSSSSTDGESRWVFNVDSWQWEHREGCDATPAPPGQGALRSAKHDIAARRWGDGRDTLGAALHPHGGGAAAEQGSPKRQRVVVSAVRGGGSGAAGWASVGGLSKQKEQLTRAVLFPLRHPALFKRLGVDAVRGVLLHGPPGSGKTALARALAGEAGEGVHFEVLNGGECVGGDDATARMRRAFHKARSQAPAILFIDELDALAPSREAAAVTSSQAERQACSQLLTLIDELRHSRAQVSLVAATNRRSALDGALRRAGRLDLEVSLGPLTLEDRLEVLRCATHSMPLGAGVDLAVLAAQLRGYTAADCVAVCTEAAVRCASDAVAAAEAEGDLEQVASPDWLGALRVERAHFETAVGQLGPAVLRGLCPELPDVSWEDVGGLEVAKAALQDLVEFPLKHGQLMAKLGMQPPRGALLYGPPGCGKTLLAKAAASCCGANFVSVRGPELLQMWLGESERAVRTLFETARCAAPCLVFFDELDSIGGRRGGDAGESGAAARVLNQLLVEMDGLGSDRGGVFVLGATNRPETLDPALLRPGRLDTLVKVSLPDESSRLSILRAALRSAPLHPGVDLPSLAALTAGCSGADLAELCRRASMAAVREWVALEEAGVCVGSGMEVDGEAEAGAGVQLRQEHLQGALGALRRSVSARAAQRFDLMEQQLREGSLAAPGQEGEEMQEGDEEEEVEVEEGGNGGGDAEPAAPQQAQQAQQQSQGELMQALVRATLDHSYASKAQALEQRVQQLEQMLREAGLEPPPLQG